MAKAKPSPLASSTAAQEAADTPPSSPPDANDSGTKTSSNASDQDYNVPPAAQMNGVSASMRAEEARFASQSRSSDARRDAQMEEQRQQDLKGGAGAVDGKFKALEYLLSQSKLYSTIMLANMQKQEDAENVRDEKGRKKAAKREEEAERAAVDYQRKTTRAAAKGAEGGEEAPSPVKVLPTRGAPAKKDAGKKSQGKVSEFLKMDDLKGKAGRTTVQEALEEEAGKDDVKTEELGAQNLKSARQPDLVTGGMMRGYQLEGLEWLISLYENGLNGILADEMGLGKTVQTISFLAFLREKGTNGPFLIAAPLSTTTNWIDEFHRWTPTIPVVLYHGSKAEREEIRRKQLRNPGRADFPVVCTSYEICMNDRKHLANMGWKFVIIDEGHRIKNLNCRLIRELQSYQSANRLLITGTPLQNNLSELWSLLHFLMPDIFDKLESFESWFDFSALKEKNGYEQILSEEKRRSLVTSLHAILKPFLLRRIKADVEHSMPKKREYVLYAPLSTEQRELYNEILHGNSRSYLEDKVVETINSRAASGTNTPQSIKTNGKRKAASLASNGTATPNKSAKTSRDSTPATNGTSASKALGRRSKKAQNYSEISDAQYFAHLSDEQSQNPSSSSESEATHTRAATLALAKKEISQKKLQNPIMQLRLCCNSPHNFYDPFPDEDEQGSSSVDYSALTSASGKMQLLDRLLTALLASPENHKVLIFSQFKTQLDLLSLYLDTRTTLTKAKKPKPAPILHCRIDGSIPQSERAESITQFNTSSAHRVFLLSTRAGGQGINLAAADTVILFDSDWNPQQDLQAQDRAHRIGQTRNVLVFRLATRATVEELLLGKAQGKRRLEKLVIRKGGVRAPRDANDGDDGDVVTELQDLLARNDGETMDFAATEDQLLSDKDLATVLDRSEEAYARAAAGESGERFRAVETKRDGEGLLEGLEG